MLDHTTPKMYFRCHDCLTVICTTDLQKHQRHAVTCGICNGRMEYMGDVTGKTWAHATEVCTCNEVCQIAKGPDCTCRCGGENHGKGYKYTLHADATGTVILPKEENAAKRLQIADDYRNAEAAAVARIHALPLYNDYCNGRWIDRGAWDAIHNAEYKLNEARKGVMQTNRLAKFAKVAA